MTASSQAAVLFDLDGTLLDTSGDFVEVVLQLCNEHSVSPPSELNIRNTVSDGARALVELALNVREGEAGFEALRTQLLALYSAQLGKSTLSFEGIPETLNTIKRLGLNWGIVTNKPRRYAAPLLEAMNLKPSMGILVCPEDVSQTKPHPEPLLKAANALNANPENCLYVGDHLRDIEAGQAAGMKTAAAAYGYVASQSEAEGWQADFLIQHAHELVNLIETLYGAP